VNRIRRENPALQEDWRLTFHDIDNDHLICYSKSTPDHSNVILVAVNLDPRYRQSGWTRLALDELGVAAGRPFQAHDLLTGAQYAWSGPRNFIELDPQLPVHLLRLGRDAGAERR
jgi:starch synthase (maltosyl-transferring)